MAPMFRSSRRKLSQAGARLRSFRLGRKRSDQHQLSAKTEPEASSVDIDTPAPSLELAPWSTVWFALLIAEQVRIFFLGCFRIARPLRLSLLPRVLFGAR